MNDRDRKSAGPPKHEGPAHAEEKNAPRTPFAELAARVGERGLQRRLAERRGDREATDPARQFEQATSGAGAAVPYRAEMERAFGQDFSTVPAHLGRKAEMESIGALAATDGASVAFAHPSPDRETVAHELAHVVQQRRGDGGAGSVQQRSLLSQPDDSAEVEAARIGKAVAVGETVEVGAAPSAGIHRFSVGGALNQASNAVSQGAGEVHDAGQNIVEQGQEAGQKAKDAVENAAGQGRNAGDDAASSAADQTISVPGLEVRNLLIAVLPPPDLERLRSAAGAAGRAADPAGLAPLLDQHAVRELVEAGVLSGSESLGPVGNAAAGGAAGLMDQAHQPSNSHSESVEAFGFEAVSARAEQTCQQLASLAAQARAAGSRAPGAVAAIASSIADAFVRAAAELQAAMAQARSQMGTLEQHARESGRMSGSERETVNAGRTKLGAVHDKLRDLKESDAHSDERSDGARDAYGHAAKGGFHSRYEHRQAEAANRDKTIAARMDRGGDGADQQKDEIRRGLDEARQRITDNLRFAVSDAKQRLQALDFAAASAAGGSVSDIRREAGAWWLRVQLAVASVDLKVTQEGLMFMMQVGGNALGNAVNVAANASKSLSKTARNMIKNLR